MEPTLFEAAEAAREKGMADAAAHSGDEWCETAFEFCQSYLVSHDTFFVDDFWRWALKRGLIWPKSPRAIGPVILRLGRLKAMVKTGEYRKSVRSNNSIKPVWRSLVYSPSPSGVGEVR